MVPVHLPQGKIYGSEWGWDGGSAGSDWWAPWVSIRWSRLSSRVLFVLLFFPEAHYSARSYFTTEIFIFQVMCACGVIPSDGASGNWQIPVNRTVYPSCLVQFSTWQKLFPGLHTLFIPEIYSKGNAASVFINAAGVATSPWHHSRKCCGHQLIFHFSAVRRSWQETLSNI